MTSTELRWRAGKFVYPRGSSVPVHYMPLQIFSLEKAQDYSLIVALRMARIERQDALLEKYEVAKWRDTLKLDALAELVVAGIGSHARIIDVGGFNGVFFEELKVLLGEREPNPAYLAWLPNQASREIFRNVHAPENWPYKITAELPSSLSDGDILVINQAGAIREISTEIPPWTELLDLPGGGMVLALRVASAGGRYRTTIRGRHVDVPGLDEAIAALRGSGKRWAYRWLPKHDNDYFLPEEERHPVGLLLATNLEGSSLPGLKPL